MAVRCTHCGAPSYGVIEGRCRYCGTIVAAPASPAAQPSPVGAWAEPPVEPEVDWWQSYPLAYGPCAGRIWSVTRGQRGWHRIPLVVLAVVGIPLAWGVITAWLMTAAFLAWLGRDDNGKGPWNWLALKGIERPWVGFTVGAIEVFFAVELLVEALRG